MPFCLPAAAIALTAAGTGATMAGNAKAQRNMERKVQQELIRQKGYQQQADAVYQANAQASDPTKAKSEISSGASEREQAYQQAQAVPLGLSQAQNVIDTPTQETADAKTSLSNRSRSALMGYEQQALLQALRNSQANNQIGAIGGFSRGSNSVLPLELSAAQRSGEGLQNLGSLLGLAGMATGVAGTTGLCNPTSNLAAAGGSQLLLSPAQQAAMVSSPVGQVTPGRNNAGFGSQTLFPSLGNVGNNMSGLYGLSRKF